MNLKDKSIENEYGLKIFDYNDVKKSILEDIKDFNDLKKQIETELLCIQDLEIYYNIQNLLRTHKKLKLLRFGDFEK